ncbi:2-oxoglutarate dehydrogenase E1 component [Runella zeae]|uniref:2-oxoglutarate dehydrogenase E1 component n=1 Tax=Runella zeae TaxID=94255 RepID=UPI0003F5EB85|nr:2-oxoglutarate dehydrogenase E1 component [Runella zeae]
MEKYSYIANSEAAYIEELYQKYQQQPDSVDLSWQRFFEGFEFSIKYGENKPHVNGNGAAAPTAEKPVSASHTRKEMEVVHLIRGYRQRGHLKSQTNPLGPRKDRQAQLELQDFNLSEGDLDTVFEAGIEVFGRPAKLREIVEALQKVYTQKIGFEYQYIRDRRAKSWLRKKIEDEYLNFKPTIEQKKRILEKLNEAVTFENFLHTKFLGKKRFSLEGGEATIPALDVVLNRGAELGVEEVVIGMAHRGRLNVLTNIMQKSYDQIFNEFEENVVLDEFSDGDVKYHMGYESQVETTSGKRVSLKLMPNPSHLEAVNPVVVGYARARADEHYNHISGQDKYDPVLPILIHGDAAVAGQGIVYEVTQMSNLPAYYTGGTLHFVINNQVGFTTDHEDNRSSIYCSDIARIVDAPIFHVNGNDPEAVAFVMKIAVEFRQEFNRDVFVDMVCYRKYGHNEADEPRFTQPTMYTKISQQLNGRDLYMKMLTERGELDAQIADQMKVELEGELQELLQKVKQKQLPYQRPKLERDWAELRRSIPEDFEESPATGISNDIIEKVRNALTTLPEGFKVLKQIEKVIEERKQIFSGEKPFNWSAGELLAYGSILAEGRTVRMTGQDVQRGTFSHRHAVLHEIDSNENYNSLAHIGEGQGIFEIYNSLLSEYGVMGFEYGYAMANPHALVIWEAQFGDFANGAQIMVDQFISATESKWNAMNGLVMLLPHGYEGQGPEHSSARPERFLILSAEYNMYVCNVTTPANFFHMIRRQLALPFRKPCILMSPKSMLRSPYAVSPMSDFEEGTRFQETIGDTFVEPKKVKRVLLCTGKLYWELYEKQQKDNRKDVAIIRIEQLHPFPEKQVEAHLAQYKKAEVIWVQEEPENMGYWTFVLRAFPQIGLGKVLARKPSASPATGYMKIHAKEQAELIEQAFNVG